MNSLVLHLEWRGCELKKLQKVADSIRMKIILKSEDKSLVRDISSRGKWSLFSACFVLLVTCSLVVE